MERQKREKKGWPSVRERSSTVGVCSIYRKYGTISPKCSRGTSKCHS